MSKQKVCGRERKYKILRVVDHMKSMSGIQDCNICMVSCGFISN